MLPRRARLGRERLTELMKTGARAHGRLFTYVYSKDALPAFGIVVSKKVAKTSVLRHKMRRRTYAALTGLSLPHSVILIAKEPAKDALPRTIREEIERILIRKV